MVSLFKRFFSSSSNKKSGYSRDELEDILLEADIEYEIVEKVLNELPKNNIKKEQLKNSLILLFDIQESKVIQANPFVELIIGVNGAGKTTTIAKLAAKYKKENQKVIIGAGDTFRAAAIEQIGIWADRLGVTLVKTAQGHDPSAVAYDTISSAKAKKYDKVIIDTAGRLQTQTNLSNELKKIVRTCDKAMAGAPHRIILRLDGTQGNSAIAQAKAFDDMVGIDGIIITKLDGTVKGGSIFSIVNRFKKPIYYIGVGEGSDDLIEFKAIDFIDNLLDNFYN